MSNKLTLSYVQYVNQGLRNRFEGTKGVIFGQNIVAGSRISGLGAGLDSLESVTAINTPNVENSLMGFGLGLMLSSTDSVFLMKQHDFALLGLDQLTNTVNVVKTRELTASFIVLMVVVDSGYEGPQASLNNLDEFASLSRSPVYLLNTKNNIDFAFEKSKSPGLHFMALGQSCMKKEIIDFGGLSKCINSGDLLEKKEKSQVLIIYFGLDIGYLETLQIEFGNMGIRADSLIVNRLERDLKIENQLLREYESILVLDQSKSDVSYAQKMSFELARFLPVTYITRVPSLNWCQVSDDLPEISPAEAVRIWQNHVHAAK